MGRVSGHGRLAGGVVILLLLLFISAAAQEYGDAPIASDTGGYVEHTLRYHRPRIEVSIAYPEIRRFPKKMRRMLNHAILVNARKAFNEGRDLLPDSKTAIDDDANYYADRTVEVWFLDSNMVSILYSWDIYSGGAHPGGFYSSEVYRVGPDTLHDITLAKLFKQGSGYDSVLADLIMADVLDHDPDKIWDDGEELRHTLIEYGLGSFALTRDGLLFADWPGPHVAGPIEVLIPYEAIASYIDPKGVLGRWGR